MPESNVPESIPYIKVNSTPTMMHEFAGKTVLCRIVALTPKPDLDATYFLKITDRYQTALNILFKLPEDRGIYMFMTAEEGERSEANMDRTLEDMETILNPFNDPEKALSLLHIVTTHTL